MRKQKKDIIIVGLGLMGASLGKTLRMKFRGNRIVGLSRSAAKIKKAKQQGIIDFGTTQAKIAFKNAEIIIVATPVSQIEKYIKLANRLAPTGTLVTDIGSTKEKLFNWAKKQKFKRIHYIGSHPLAGSHLDGLKNAVNQLYTDATCLIALSEKVDKKALEKLAKFWKRVGCRVCLITPKEHDQLLAASSHFPHVLAYSLINHNTRNSRDALTFVGSGYKDLTRIAESLPSLWVDIILSNKKNILRESKQMIQELQRLNQIISNGSRGKLNQYLKKAKDVRSAL